MGGWAARLGRCYSGAVYDTMRSLGIASAVLPSSIAALEPGMRLAGPVFTMRGRSQAGMDAHETLLAWTGFLSKAPAGHVVVCQPNDDVRALMGELSAETLKRRGVLGYLVDGGCRDVDFICEIRFPVFCRFTTPIDVVGAWCPEAFEEPVTIGDVTIRPGDYVLGDRDGVVAIPGERIGEVVEAVEAVMQTESLVRKAILAGQDPQQAYLQYGKF